MSGKRIQNTRSAEGNDPDQKRMKTTGTVDDTDLERIIAERVEAEVERRVAVEVKKHVRIARPFIYDRMSQAPDRSAVEKIWKRLADSKLMEDLHLQGKALWCGMAPTTVLEKATMLPENLTKLLSLATAMKTSTAKFPTGIKAREIYDLLSDDLRVHPDVLAALIRACSNMEKARELWNTFDKKAKDEQEPTIAAWQRNIPFKFLNKAIVNNEDIIKESLTNRLLDYSCLTAKQKRDVDIALCALSSDSNLVFENVVGMVSDQERLWRDFACNNVKRVYCWKKAPNGILSDKELMLRVVSECGEVLSFVQAPITSDLGFMEKALTDNPAALQYVTTEVFQHLPKLLSAERLCHFGTVSKSDNQGANLTKNVPKQCWGDLSFSRNWISAGLRLHENLPQVLMDNEQLLLKHASNFYQSKDGNMRFPGFEHISPRLLSDKPFLRKLLKIAPSDQVPFPSNQYDYRLLSLAVSKPYKPHCIPLYYPKMRRHFLNWNAFSTAILCGSSATLNPNHPLNILDHGDANIKRVIASYLDFPIGEMLGDLLKAVEKHPSCL